MDEEIKTGEMIGEIDESIAVEEDFTLLEGQAVTISDDSDNKTDEEEVYEEALDIKESLDDIRDQIKDKLLDILEKGKITDADGCEIELLNDQYTEKYNELKDIANTVIPGGKGTNSDTSSTEKIEVNINYDEILKAISEKADWLYIDEDGQVMLNGEVVPKLKVVELEAEKIKADVGEFKNLTTENFTATNAEIENLKANKANVVDLNATNANIANLQATKADITELNAAKGNINTLTSNLADITTLVNGNLTSDNIQSMVITGDKFTVANGFIKNAMIESINANKINTGTINTNNVSVQSADGSMVINGATQQFKDKNNKVRIQIGKDAQGNFTFALFSQDGVGVLIDETGIKSGAVPDGLIVNDMVSDSANISGSKLDINSVISSINNGTTVIKGTRIQLDEQGQSLQVAFSQLKSKVETIENVTIDGDLSSVIEQVTTNTTNITTMQGQISSLISNTTITKANGEVVQLKDEYNSTKSTVNSHSTKIGSLETNLATANNNISSVSSKQTALEQNLDGFKQAVSNTYTTKADFNNLSVGGRNYWVLKDLTNGYESNGSITSSTPTHKIRQTLIETNGAKYLCYQIWNPNKHTNDENSNRLAFYDSSKTIISSQGLPKLNGTDYQTAVYNIPNNAVYVRLAAICGPSGAYDTSIKVKFEFGNKPTSWTPAPEDIDASITAVDNKFTNYSTTTQMNSAITQKASEITSTVSETYATKASVTDVSNNLKNNYSTTSAMNSAINQKANEITSTVSETYATKQEINAITDTIGDYVINISNEIILFTTDLDGNIT